MDANEIVIKEMQRHGVLMVLKLFGERIREPGHAARVHADVQVVPFRIGRADVLRVRRAFDPMLDDARAIGGAVAALGALGSCPVQLNQHGVVDISAEGVLDRAKVRLVAV